MLDDTLSVLAPRAKFKPNRSPLPPQEGGAEDRSFPKT